MNAETALEQVKQLLEPLLQEDVFLVDFRIKPTNNFKIFLDADNGLSIDKCIKINRALYKAFEEKGWYPEGDFSLEVSSPGIDEPLKLFRQYKKNVGRKLAVVLNDDSKKEGKLLAAAEDFISLEYTEGKGKKALVKTDEVPFENIKQATVLIQF